MDRHKFLFVAVALSASLFTGSPLVTHKAVDPLIPCPDSARRTVGCPGLTGSISDGSANIGAESSRRSEGSGSRSDRDPTPPLTPNKKYMTREQRSAYELHLAQEAEEAGRYYRQQFWMTYVGTPPTVVTLNDIASFRPTVGGNYMEPNSWIVVGLPTNFYSDPSAQVVDGTLLGLPASVRFTARSWNWSFGDGTSSSSGTPGASWAAQGLGEFEQTATSHVFANPGTYTIDLSVEYTAEYQFGNRGWVPIDGTLVVPTNSIVATAGDAKTVLVNRDCTDDSEGPGC